MIHPWFSELVFPSYLSIEDTQKIQATLPFAKQASTPISFVLLSVGFIIVPPEGLFSWGDATMTPVVSITAPKRAAASMLF